MRAIGTVAGEREARALADHLLARKITTKVVPDKVGWTVWVHDENRLAEATEEFRAYRDYPADPRFAASREAAAAVRKAADEADRSYRKNVRDVSERWTGSPWRAAPFTYALILACVAVGLLTRLGEGNILRSEVGRALLFSDVSFRINEGLVSNGLGDIRRGEVWRLVTPIFLHFGVLHLLFNLVWLRQLGAAIEARRRTPRLVAIVVAAAVLSNIGQYLIYADSSQIHPFGGMSGVVYALFGYAWMKGLARPEEGLGVPPNTVVLMLGWFVLCTTGLVGPIANGAHGVGLVVGMFLGLTRF